MLTIALLLLTLDPPQPLNLDGMTIERARTLHGKQVTVTFLVAKPTYYYQQGVTSVGAADLPDGAERGVYLRGKRFDVEEGRRITVTGKLQVIDWPGYYINGGYVLPWTHIRVDEGK